MRSDLGSDNQEGRNQEYYRKVPSGYKINTTDVDGVSYQIEPFVYQPKAIGAEIIAKHYKEKYGIDIIVVDQSQEDVAGDQLKARFKKFKEKFDFTGLQEGKPIGVLLMHGQHHALPFILSHEQEEKNYMVVFDSSSGARVKGYYHIANMFPDYKVLLNSGTRQGGEDGVSCIVDGLAILKDALRIKGIGKYIYDEKSIDSSGLSPISPTGSGDIVSSVPMRPQFFSVQLAQDNFRLFRMPERLLKTAQRSEFVNKSEPDLDMNIRRDGKEPQTLRERRDKDKTFVSFNKEPEKDLGINCYLHKKSVKYEEIINQKLQKESPAITR